MFRNVTGMAKYIQKRTNDSHHLPATEKFNKNGFIYCIKVQTSKNVYKINELKTCANSVIYNIN